MPTTVTASNGNTYHLWQLPDLATPEPNDSIEYATLDNDLSDGYRSSVLFGSNNGTRSWNLKVPTSASLDVLASTVTDPSGAAVSRNEYLRSLFAENKIGEPFAFTDPVSGQYYLVDFEDTKISFDRMRIKLYSTGVTLKQRRMPGVTVFTPQRFSNVWGDWDGPTAFSAGFWPPLAGGLVGLGVNGDVTEVAAAQNGLAVKRFNSGAGSGYINTSVDPTIYEAFFAVKINEATFSANGGLLTNDATTGLLAYAMGATKFANQAFGSTVFEYRRDGILYPESNQIAPMNEWGIVHIRYKTGAVLNNLQIGKNGNTLSYTKMDLGEAILCTGLLSPRVGREITEYLAVKWGISG